MKRFLSVVLAGVMVCGLSVNAFALKKIADVSSTFKYTDYVVSTVTDGKTKTNVDPDSLSNYDATPDDVIKIYLTSNMFVDSTGAIVNDKIAPAMDLVTTSALRAGKVSVRRSTSKGKDIIESLALKNDKKNGAYIEIQFVEYFVSVKEKDFDVTIYLTVNNKKRTNTTLKIAGTMENTIIEVDDGDDYVNLSDGEVAEAQSYIRSIDVDLGNGVTLTSSMTRNTKYYGVADPTPTAADEVVLSNNPSVEEVYNLKTVNLKKTGKVVSIDAGYTAYVYDAAGKYIGTTKEKLAYSTKYYLASKKVTSVKV